MSALDANWSPVPLWAGGLISRLNVVEYNDQMYMVCGADGNNVNAWNNSLATWEPLYTSNSVQSQYAFPGYGPGGIYEVVQAPSNPSTIYMMDELYCRMNISTNGGASWTVNGAYPQFQTLTQLTENELSPNWRFYSKKGGVNPTQQNVVIWTNSGFSPYISLNGGASWAAITAVPATLKEGTQYPSMDVIWANGNTVYIMVYGSGMWTCTDTNPPGSQTWSTGWTLLSGTNAPAANAMVYGSAMHPNGTLYVIVTEWNGTAWTNLAGTAGLGDIISYTSATNTWSLVSKGQTWSYSSIAINSNGVIATTGASGALGLSYDNGVTWKYRYNSGPVLAGDTQWYQRSSLSTYMSAGLLAFNPISPNVLYMASGDGVTYCTIPDHPPATWPVSPDWVSMNRGHQDLELNQIVCAPWGGTLLISAWDFGAFLCTALTPPTQNNTYNPGLLCPSWNGEFSWQTADAGYAAVSAVPSYGLGSIQMGYTTNANGPLGSVTWQPFATLPPNVGVTGGGGGTLAVGSKNNLVWHQWCSNGALGGLWHTSNGGTTWAQSSIPNLAGFDWSLLNSLLLPIVAADRVNPNQFTMIIYGKSGIQGPSNNFLGPNGVIYTGTYLSTDGGATFQQVSTGVPGTNTYVDNGCQTLVAVPGNNGHVFYVPGYGFNYGPYWKLSSAEKSPLFISTNAGTTWVAVPNVCGVTALGVGATVGGPANTYPAIYIAGVVNSVYGIWGCYNGQTPVASWTWTQLGEFPCGDLGNVQSITGDMVNPGAVFTVAKKGAISCLGAH